MGSYKEGGWQEKYYIQKIKMAEKCLKCNKRSVGEMGLGCMFSCPVFESIPVDPEAIYFVLRLDEDPHARKAALSYADSVEVDNPVFARDIRARVAKLEGGGRG